MSASLLPVAIPTPLAPEIEPAIKPAIETGAQSKPRTHKQAWLALHFAEWPLHAALQALTAEQRLSLAQQPVVVLDHDRQRRVLAGNAAALANGIRPGHTLNAALALCAELKLLPRDAAAETKLLIEMADWAQCYTPVISIEPPNELVLEVRGSLHLFGGVSGLLQHIRQALQARQLAACLALSPTARASLCLARCMRHDNAMVITPRQLKTALSALPLTCLGWSLAVQLRLARFGVTRLGELWRLPRADLARRIGIQHLHELDAAMGRRVELRLPFKRVPPYEQHVSLDFEIVTTLLLEPVLSVCLNRLQDYLREHDLAMGRLHIELRHREQASSKLRIGLATPSSEMPRVAALLHEQLSRLVLPAPVLAIKLRVPRLLAAQGIAQDLLAGATQGRPELSRLDLSKQEMLGRLLERLQARLGPAAVRVLQLQADHRPEYAQTWMPAELKQSSIAVKPSAMLSIRPLWFLPEPVLLCMGVKPSDELQLMQGPERIEAGWWHGMPLKRDYYVARYRNHSWCWVFKNLLQPAWYLHGWFA